jgi:hypothetical protein
VVCAMVEGRAAPAGPRAAGLQRPLLPPHRDLRPARRPAPVAVRALPRGGARARRSPRSVGTRPLQEHDHHVLRRHPGDRRRPDITIGLFSFNQKIAHAFVKQVKREFESNETLRAIYEDVLYEDPKNESPLWTDHGFIVRRSSNPKEGTLEGWGLVNGQPTSKHYALRIYDDVVTRDSVTNEDMVRKVTEAYELSDNLGGRQQRKWLIGTRYSFADTYGQILKAGVVKPRIYPATHNGRPDGNPVFLSPADVGEEEEGAVVADRGADAPEPARGHRAGVPAGVVRPTPRGRRRSPCTSWSTRRRGRARAPTAPRSPSSASTTTATSTSSTATGTACRSPSATTPSPGSTSTGPSSPACSSCPWAGNATGCRPTTST